MPTLDEMQSSLKCLSLNTNGNKKKLKNRLRNSSRQKADKAPKNSSKPNITTDSFFCVCDFEATCEEDSGFEYLNEIIEFPVILIHHGIIVSTFHRHVKPKIKPVLSKFCVALTGISQEIVDNAEPFDVVLSDFGAWLYQNVDDIDQCHFVTDGPWDIRQFMKKNCRIHNITRNSFLSHWIDLRSLYSDAYQKDRSNLSGMLTGLDLKFEGREHCGLDDTKNIARIFRKFLANSMLQFDILTMAILYGGRIILIVERDDVAQSNALEKLLEVQSGHHVHSLEYKVKGR